MQTPLPVPHVSADLKYPLLPSRSSGRALGTPATLAGPGRTMTAGHTHSPQRHPSLGDRFLVSTPTQVLTLSVPTGHRSGESRPDFNAV